MKVMSVRDLSSDLKRFLSESSLDPKNEEDVKKARKELRKRGCNVPFPTARRWLTSLQRKRRKPSSAGDGKPSFVNNPRLARGGRP